MPRNASNASTMAMIILRVLTICHPLARSSVRGTQGDKTARHVFFHSRRTPGQTVPGHFGYLFPESRHGSLLSRKRKTRIQRHLRSRMRRTRHAAPPIISIAGEYAGFKTTLRRTAMQDVRPETEKISRKKLQLMQTSRSVDRLSRAMPVPITTVERGSSTTKMGSDVSSRSS